MLRGGAGLRRGLFEFALLADAGLMLDAGQGTGTELQFLLRLCIEAGAALPMGRSVNWHLGGRGCMGFAEMRKGTPGARLGNPGADVLSGVASGGAYTAVSFGLSDGLRLGLRADVEAASLAVMSNGPVVIAILSVVLSVS